MSNSEITLSQYKVPQAAAWSGAPAQALKKAAAKCEDGHLHAQYDSTVWKVYFHNGRLRYASNSEQSLKTLAYHFRCVGLDSFSDAQTAISQAGIIPHTADWLRPETQNLAINWFHRQGFVDIMQCSYLLENLTKEALESFLWLTDAHYQWISSDGEAERTQILESRLDLEEVLIHFEKRIKAWQQFSGLIKSPHQRPYLFSQSQQDNSSADILRLGKLLRGMSIRQLALALNQDELKIAQFLYPYIQRGDVYLRDPQKPYRKLPCIPPALPTQPNRTTPVKTFKIACIDDSQTILDEMHRFLNHEEYEVTKIDDPVKAASVLFRLKPDLVLMDITMPEINGYKLCSLLRHSVALRETPIVMVTGRSGMIDKARAKMVGATDYLVKPFTRGSLLAVVEKCLR